MKSEHYPLALSLSKGGSCFDKLTANGFYGPCKHPLRVGSPSSQSPCQFQHSLKKCPPRITTRAERPCDANMSVSSHG